MESSKKAITETEETRANRKQATREERIRANRIFKFRMLVMIFINICPVFHWMRNHKNIRNFYYYVCLAEYEKVKNSDSEVLEILHNDLIDSKDSFDKLYAVAHFLNSPEYKALVKSAPRKNSNKTKSKNIPTKHKTN